MSYYIKCTKCKKTIETAREFEKDKDNWFIVPDGWTWAYEHRCCETVKESEGK